MRSLDSEAINKIKIPSIVLMENAASSVARIVLSKFNPDVFRHIIVLAGPGNNGGDGIAVGRKLCNRGYSVQIILLTDPGNLRGDPLLNLKIAENIGLKVNSVNDINVFIKIMRKYPENETVIIDSIFGTGLSRSIEDSFYIDVFKFINNFGSKVVSVDIPSGLSDNFDCIDSPSVAADLTVTFQALKIPLLFPEILNKTGEIWVADIGIPSKLLNNKNYYVELISSISVSPVIHTSSPSDHKGIYGHSLVIGGSDDKPGAAMLSSFASLRTGGGLVTCTESIETVNSDLKRIPEVMTVPFASLFPLKDIDDKYKAVLAGPGLGTDHKIKDLVVSLIDILAGPLVLDADALNVIKGEAGVLKKKRGVPPIITPHPLEFSRLSGISVREIKAFPIKIAREFSINYNVYLVLKGHHTIVSTPRGNVYINETGNPGMATAGSGDVLGGILLGLISRTLDKFPLERILCAGVFIHGLAGDFAEKEMSEVSMVASDIIEKIPEAIKKTDEYKSEIGII